MICFSAFVVVVVVRSTHIAVEKRFASTHIHLHCVWLAMSIEIDTRILYRKACAQRHTHTNSEACERARVSSRWNKSIFDIVVAVMPLRCLLLWRMERKGIGVASKQRRKKSWNESSSNNDNNKNEQSMEYTDTRRGKAAQQYLRVIKIHKYGFPFVSCCLVSCSAHQHLCSRLTHFVRRYRITTFRLSVSIYNGFGYIYGGKCMPLVYSDVSLSIFVHNGMRRLEIHREIPLIRNIRSLLYCSLATVSFVYTASIFSNPRARNTLMSRVCAKVVFPLFLFFFCSLDKRCFPFATL